MLFSTKGFNLIDYVIRRILKDLLCIRWILGVVQDVANRGRGILIDKIADYIRIRGELDLSASPHAGKAVPIDPALEKPIDPTPFGGFQIRAP